MRLTATILTTQFTCPFLRYVLYDVKEPFPVLGTRRRFGRIVHAARAAYEQSGGRLEKGLEVLDEQGRRMSPKDRDDARAILLWSHEQRRKREGHPILIEGPLHASVSGHRLDVRMDRLDRGGEWLILVEYKTGKRVDLEIVRTQMTILSYAVWYVFGQAPRQWEVELLGARKIVTLDPVTEPAALEYFTMDLARSLARGDREPKPFDTKFCRKCPARAYCPRWTPNPIPVRTALEQPRPQLLLF